MPSVQQELEGISIITFLLFFKFFYTATFQGTKRQRAPEDKIQQPTQADATKAFDDSKRWERIVMNDLENIPWGMIMMWACVLVQADRVTTLVAAAVFLVARVLHSICYIYQLMPWRTYCWALGVLANFTLGINLIFGAFNYGNYPNY